MLKTVCGNFPSIETAFKLMISFKTEFFPASLHYPDIVVSSFFIINFRRNNNVRKIKRN
ncbi:hypothetical protein [Treponema pedis]|uniref:Uncharacterized protein n=1 Tax=Treponema pedis str. T A4 TaxID=1291379 RepID=S6A7Y9_9SPIR|nr:hypothetical protein [Treponema pedis]AGT42914.1 hypothetical protein TPE_0418 [Treponema pedis str. T A4]